MPASTTGAPLVPRRRRRAAKKGGSWWDRHVGKTLTKLNPWNLLKKKRASTEPRTIFINEPLPQDYYDKKGRVLKNKVFPSNQNITSKYTVLTFVPRNLLEQFRRVANIFFLGIAILQFFPKFATISPGLVILPLIVVLGITLIKDGIEDVKRHQADRKVNHSEVHILGGGDYVNTNPTAGKSKTFVKGIPLPRRKSKKAKKREQTPEANNVETPAPETPDLSRARSQVSNWEDDPEAGDSSKELGWQRTIWEDIKVGDFVKIYDHEQIPADIIVCATSEEEDVCYVETKNLDGETNLKSRHGVPGLANLHTAQACAHTHLRIDLDAPEVNMYRLNGAVYVEGEDGDDVHPVSLDTVLLRGCVLRNTAWVVGIVAFTGDDTKIIQNSGGAPSKRSKVERQMNPQVLFNLSILGIMSMVCAIIDHFLEKRWTPEGAYWMLYNDQPGDNPNINGLITFLNALITFQNIIPISLYISIEFVRSIQALFIYWDHDIQYFKNGVKFRTLARSWNLSDDLGQIEYIFSDKTGTLTQNVMVFRQCSIGGKIYYGDETEEPKPTGLKPTISNSDTTSSDDDAAKKPEPSTEREVPPFRDAQLTADLAQYSETEQSRLVNGFFTVLGLCHTALAAESPTGQITYKAQSPDEEALVQTAADVGYVFRGRDRNILRMSTPFSSEPEEYELMNVLEFTSARKRMSVIVRKCDDSNQLFLLCKGADNIIFERLDKDDKTQNDLQQRTDKDLQQFANEGLRTLCLAYRILDPEEYEEWADEYHQAEVSLDDREGAVEAASSKIETKLTLLGATAIEDKLQDGVPETIADLKRAGIKVWVATGDKLETAVAIGYTTNLLTPETNLIIVRKGNHTVYEQLRDSLEGFFGDDSLTRSFSHSNTPRNSLSAMETRQSTQLQRVNTGVGSLVGEDNGHRPGGFSLVIEGSALTDAFDDEDTGELLLALSMKCNTVICCRVSPLQKAQIVRLIKDNLGVMCLAIGDGANDVSMIQAADVGVGISGEEGLQAVNSSDYAIGQFRFLKRLLFVHGHWSYFRNSTMICNFFYKNVMGIGVLWWFMIYCGWSTTYVYAYVYLLFWNVFWTIAPVIAIGLFERNCEADTLMALPELYRYSRHGHYYNWKRFLYYLMEGVYQTAIIYFILHFTYVTTSTRGDGWDVFKDEMSTTMAVTAVMAANLFSGLNIDAWSWWVVFAVWVGPFLIWVFTAIYSVVPPSMYSTGLYGNDVFLFRSCAYWFGWPFGLVFALLPRYLIKYLRQNVFTNDIELMRLVHKYDSNIDVFNHPMLGGHFKHTGEAKEEEEYSEEIRSYSPDNSANDIALQKLSTSGGDGSTTFNGDATTAYDSNGRRPSLQIGRPSFQSQRSSRFGMHSAGRGSAVDMSTGLTREPSRGFGFNMEEHGVAVQRMQSRLSQASQDRRQGYILRRLAVANRMNEPTVEGSPSSALGKLRSRAGTILKPRNRSSTTNTRASSQHSDDHNHTHGPHGGSHLAQPHAQGHGHGTSPYTTPSRRGTRDRSSTTDTRQSRHSHASPHASPTPSQRAQLDNLDDVFADRRRGSDEAHAL